MKKISLSPVGEGLSLPPFYGEMPIIPKEGVLTIYRIQRLPCVRVAVTEGD